MPHSVTAEKIIGQWEPAVLGVIRNVHPTKVPTDGWYDSLNAVYRDGTVQSRPGYASLTADGLASRPMGALHFPSLAKPWAQADWFQTDWLDIPDSHLTVAATTEKVWVYYGGTWHDLTTEAGGPFQLDWVQNDFIQVSGSVRLAGSADRHARFATIEIDDADGSPSLYVLVANGVDKPLQWRTKDATLATVTGDPPIWKDVTVIADHVVYIVEPFTFGWGDVLSLASWPALNRQIKADQPYELVAVRNMGTLGGVLYSTGGLWAIFAQGGSPSQRFRLEFRGFFEGPAGPSAVVDADGVHYRMTRTGRIGRFDGTTNTWVADGVWPLLRDDIDLAYASRIWGAYYASRQEVWFYYPRVGDNGLVRGVCILRLPDPSRGENSFGAFPGKLALSMSAGCDRRGVNDDILVFASESPHQVFVLGGGADDAGTPITGHWQTGLVGAPGLETFRAEGSETFVERGSGYGTLTMRPVSSYALDNPAGTLGAAVTIDLTVVPVAKEEKGEDVTGRFFGRRYEFSTPITLRWRGCRLAARRIE